jgi:hypothetical protein
MPWPALAGAVTILLLAPSLDCHVSMWVPAILGATWVVCRAAWRVLLGLRTRA